jgi:dethiobiotin synthetase
VKRYFVTASGTGVGKTLVTASLCHQLRASGRTVRALKPVISGYAAGTHDASDTAVLLDSLGLDHTADTIARMSPFRFEAALSPDMAAAREGKKVDFDALTAHCREAAAGPEDVLLIEGVGGAMVPLTETKTVLDWIAAVDAPCLLVVGSYLGTISHTLTAAPALQQSSSASRRRARRRRKKQGKRSGGSFPIPESRFSPGFPDRTPGVRRPT